MTYYVALADLVASWAHGQLEDQESGASKLRAALTNYVEQGNKLFAPVMQGLAEFYSQGPPAKEALAEIDAAITLAAQTGERWTDSMLHRIRGDVLLKRDPGNATGAEEAFRTAVAIARSTQTSASRGPAHAVAQTLTCSQIARIVTRRASAEARHSRGVSAAS